MCSYRQKVNVERVADVIAQVKPHRAEGQRVERSLHRQSISQRLGDQVLEPQEDLVVVDPDLGAVLVAVPDRG